MTILAALGLPSGLAAQKRGDTPKFHHYKIIDLGTLGGTFSQAYGISDEGWVNVLAGCERWDEFSWRGRRQSIRHKHKPNSRVPSDPLRSKSSRHRGL